MKKYLHVHLYDTFKESEHPRGQPENKGQFIEKGESTNKNILTNKEKEAVETYVNQSFFTNSLNSYIRNPSLFKKSELIYEGKKYTDIIKLIDKAISKSNLSEKTVVYRGLSLPPKSNLANTLENIENGGLITLHGYSSTSKNLKVANSFATSSYNKGKELSFMLKINLPKKFNAIDIDSAKIGVQEFEGETEEEVLLPRDLTFKVKEKIKSGKNITIVVDPVS